MDISRRGMPPKRVGPESGRLVTGSDYCIVEKAVQFSSGGVSYNIPACTIAKVPLPMVGSTEYPKLKPFSGDGLARPDWDALKLIGTSEGSDGRPGIMSEELERRGVSVKQQNWLLRVGLVMGLEGSNVLYINPEHAGLLDRGFKVVAPPNLLETKRGARGALNDGN